MIYVGVLLLGVIAWTRLPQELFPPITYPQLTVVTHYRDAAPEEIELLVTKPIEEVVGTVAGLRRVSSISKEELSLVIAEFNWGTNMDFAGLGVREKIDLIKERLPRGAEDPVVIKFNPFELPVLVLNLSGEASSHELLRIARKQIKNEIEKVEGVAVVNLSGGLEREILIEVDQGRLQASQLPISQVVEAVQRANLNYPAGTIKEAFYEYLIRTIGEFGVVLEIPQIAVGVEEEKGKVPKRESEGADRPGPLKREKGLGPPQRMILLRDIGTVKDTFRERSSVSRFNGKENVSLNVLKQAGANTLQVANRVKEAIARLQSALPPGVRLDLAYDQSVFIRNSIAGVRDAALQGGVLAFLVLLLFLGNPWAALNVAFAIPISILSTVGLMYFSGITINVISLGGLALGIGLLVDAGIVVVENIDRHRAMGKPSADAAIEGTQEVSSAIVGTVLTTVVVFLPMIFVVGIAGQLFKELAYTVTFSNLASLAVSLTLTALFASKIRPSAGRPLVEPVVDAMSRIGLTLVTGFLRHRILGTGIMILLFAGSVLSLGMLDREMLPRVDQGQFILRANLPPGTRLEVTDRVAQRIERVLQATPEVRDLTVTIGSSKEKRAEELLETLGSHQAQVLVNLKERRLRRRSTADIVQELKETFGREPLEGADIEYLLQESVFKSAFLGSTPIVVEVKGTDLPRIERLAEEVKKGLEGIPGLYGVKTSQIPPSPETKIRVMKDRAATYHLSVSDIALTAQTALKGFVATKFKEEGQEIDIRVRLRKQDRQDLNKVRRLLVHSPLELDVPLAEVAYFAVGKGPTEIRHLDQQRTILVSAQLFRRPLNEALKEVAYLLKGMSVPSATTVALTGENQQMQESFRSLAFALILSVILVYMVMASEFESLWQPFLIMGTIPMAAIGVALALMITGTPLSVMVALGFIVLGGIVVDNGIVLIDYVNLLRKEGVPVDEAVVQASQTRLRPILMTAATTVPGLLPLALGFGEGIELQGPMAITVMGGLTVSTFLTLILMPALYVMGENLFGRPAEVPDQGQSPLKRISEGDRAGTVPGAGAGTVPATVPPELPEIPADFGREEGVLEYPEGQSPSERLSEGAASGTVPMGTVPEPPSPPTLAEPLFEEPPPFEEEVPPKAEQGQSPLNRISEGDRAGTVPGAGAGTVPAAVPGPLNPRQQQLLDYLKQHGRITRKEYVQLTGASIPTAARDLKELVDRGLIHGMGPLAKGRYYELA